MKHYKLFFIVKGRKNGGK